MKKIDEETIFRLAKEVEKLQLEANSVNIAVLSMDDIHKLISQNHAVNELINYILDYESNEDL